MMKNLIVLCTLCLIFCSAAFAQSGPDDEKFLNLIAEASQLLQEQKFDRARKLCEEATKMRPTDSRPYVLSGASYLGEWRLDETSVSLGKAIEFDPNNHVVHFYKAEADRFRNSPREALIAVRRAVELKPDYAEAYLLLGDLLTDPAQRRAAFEKAVTLDPGLPVSYTRFGSRVEGKFKDIKAAEQIYRIAMEADPEKTAGRGDLGRLLVKQERISEARALWDEKPLIDEKTFPNFITVLERAEQLNSAKQALAKDPDAPDALVKMGNATMSGDSWVVDGRWERAIEYYKKALEIHPGLASAQFGICKAYVEMADILPAKNKDLDRELGKLRQMDEKLADEIIQYRKDYSGGIKGVPALPPPVKKP